MLELIGKVLDFIYGCLRTPTFLIASGIAYAKILHVLSKFPNVEIWKEIKIPIVITFELIDQIYKDCGIRPIEYCVNFILRSLMSFGIEIHFHFPGWYSSLAFVSTIIYGAQRASQRLYGPSPGRQISNFQEERISISQWSESLLAVFWNTILIIYIPINNVFSGVDRLFKSMNLQFISYKSTFQALKTIILGFFLIGIIFLIHDILEVIFRWRENTTRIKDHKFFLAALCLGLAISSISAWLSVHFV